MKFSVLASGSTGNSTYIETSNAKILIDIGTSSLYVEKKLKDMNINPNEIMAIIITHTHIDHVSGLKVFLKKYHPVLYITKKMYGDLRDLIGDNEYYFIDDKFFISDLSITPISLSHDAPDIKGYLLENNAKSIVHITDTGYINNKYLQLLFNKNAYIFESNHDIKMLMDGKYQFHLKQRILSDKGHLSNKDSAYYLSKLIGDDTEKVVLIHLSKDNNTPELAYSTFKEMINSTKYNIEPIISSPIERTELIEI